MKNNKMEIVVWFISVLALIPILCLKAPYRYYYIGLIWFAVLSIIGWAIIFELSDNKDEIKELKEKKVQP